MLLGKIDDMGKIGWISIIVLGFWLAWPVGLMVLAFLAGSGRLGWIRGRACAPGTWFNLAEEGARPDRRWNAGRFRRGFNPSGNRAFDDYREETLSRLEDEEREFQAFLDRLRKARDKQEFDSFMAERRNRTAPVDQGESI